MSILTRSGYIVDKDDFTQEEEEELTVIPEVSSMFSKEIPLPFRVFEDRHDGTIAVPRHWGTLHYGRAKHMFGHTEAAPRLFFVGELRNDVQRKAVQKSVEQLQTHGGGVLSIMTGGGKTVMALYIACALKKKTLIVVHKQFLMDQWEERIRTFVPKARVGRVHQNIEDVDNCDVVVGMLQSIAMRDYDEDTFKGFGLVIFDECHVVPAPVFSRALRVLCAPHMLGLSATPVRRDGLSRVIHWFLGPTFFEHSLTDKGDVTVSVCQYKPSRALPINMVAATTILCNMQDRNELIISKIVELSHVGHKTIVLSDRRAHCEILKSLLKKSSVDGALYLGGMKSFELEQSARKSVLLGTYGLAKEGLDIPSLDALVLATPRSDVVQACGRVLHGKTPLAPVIVDVVDQWFVGKAQFNKRKTYYHKSGFVVKHV